MVGLRTIEEELRENPELRLEDVTTLREWAKKQPHLPKLDDLPDVVLALFLRRRYNSVERAKETLDNYLTFRTLVPEISTERNTRRPDVQTYLATNYSIMLDQKDLDGNVVFFHFLHDPDVNKYDFESSCKTLLMIMDAWFLENGSAVGVTIVFDQQNFSLNHLARATLSTIQKLNYFNKGCAPISAKNIYVINATNFIQKILMVLKPLLSGELFKRIKVFTPSQIEEFYKIIPKEGLPNEYGGSAGTLEELDARSVKRLQRQEELLQKIDALKVDESKRCGPQKNMNTMFGLEGSFKKLAVD